MSPMMLFLGWITIPFSISSKVLQALTGCVWGGRDGYGYGGGGGSIRDGNMGEV